MRSEFILLPSLVKKGLVVPPVDIRVCVGLNVKDPKCREKLLQLSKKQCGPQLNPDLTAYSPQEGLELIRHPEVQTFWQKAEKAPIPPEAEKSVILLLPCSREKPYNLSNQHRDLQNTLQRANFNLRSNGVYLNNQTKESFYPVVVSEPMGAVPYNFVLDEAYPICHYDCPAFFDYPRSRGWQVTPYRNDNTAIDPTRSGFKLGPNEKREQEEGLQLIGEQVAKWLEANLTHFKGVIGLLKTPAHRRILEVARNMLGIGIYNVFDDQNKKELWEEVAKEKFLQGTTTYNRITGKRGIKPLTVEDLVKIAETLRPMPGRRMASKRWGERLPIILKIRNDPKAIEDLKWEIARQSAQLLLAQKPFIPDAIVTQVRKRYTPLTG